MSEYDIEISTMSLDSLELSSNKKTFKHTYLTHQRLYKQFQQQKVNKYGGWNFNSGNYLFTTDTK